MLNGFDKKVIIMIISVCFLSLSYAKEMNLYFKVGVNHNLYFKEPKLILDTNYNPDVNYALKIFPSFGYYFAMDLENWIKPKIFSYKIGLEYSHYNIIYKSDTLSAIYKKHFFLDPVIQLNRKYNVILLPINLTVHYRIISLDIGITNTLFFSRRSTYNLLSGKEISSSNNSGQSRFTTSFFTSINIHFNKNYGAGILYQHKIDPALNLSFLTFSIHYSITINKK